MRMLKALLGAKPIVGFIAAAAIPIHWNAAAEHPDAARTEVGSTASQRESSPQVPLEASRRIREGSHITDAVGEFQRSSDRFTFLQQDSKHAIRVLENLALERVSRMIEDDPTRRLWSVSGVITEYHGENFLLLTRAVLKPRTKSATSKPEKKAAVASESKSNEALRPEKPQE